MPQARLSAGPRPTALACWRRSLECPQCQLQNPLGANFCGQCGTPLELVCPVCLAVSPVGNRFCHRCGASLRGEPRSIASHPPGSYTPKHLVERVLTTRSALEGERKQVTVLFCDLANSTALAERLGPEAMHTVLNRFFELALAEVRLETLEPVQVKGKTEPVVASRVLGPRPRRSPLAGLEERALSPFVGRERELTTLHELLTQVETGQGQVVGLVGEAGVGKSRLLFEFRQGLSERRV